MVKVKTIPLTVVYQVLMRSFAGKVILITGATSGIGKALALQMAGKDVKLILTGRRVDALALVEQECIKKGAICFVQHLDIASTDSIKSFVQAVSQQYKTLDILINNAGISQRSRAEETPIAIDRQIMEVNFFGQVDLTKSLWPLLVSSGHANIVLISSVTGSFGFSRRSAYAASKHALEGFFESWMIENNKTNIFFTTVSPGRIFTNISRSALQADGTAYGQMEKGLEKGIAAEMCAKKIIKGIHRDQRKIYVAQNEMILVLLRKLLPFLFFRIAKKLNTA